MEKLESLVSVRISDSIVALPKRDTSEEAKPLKRKSTAEVS